GNDDPWCGDGCQPEYGNCSATSTNPPRPPTSSIPFPDGACGPTYGGQTCANSTCCSEWGFCGIGDGYCGAGCQAAFGQCNSGAHFPDGACGPQAGGQTCFNAPSGSCCSRYGYCGAGVDFCGAGCQSAYGECQLTNVSSSTAPSSSAPGTTYPDGACGASAGGQTCANAPSGPCCSQYGYCGTGAAFCGAGCQMAISSTMVSSSSSPVSTYPAGACGANAGNQTCANAPSGPCCSRYGYCGTGSDFCGAGCQSSFGQCWTNTTSSSVGASTCANAPSGRCCSQYGYCGSGNDFCGAGCQSLFGECWSNATSSASRPASSSSTCANAPSGPCCSLYGYCGSGNDFCGAGCQSAFGECWRNVTSSSSSLLPASSTCGANAGGQTCANAPSGRCCSLYGYCGTGADFCGAGCQSMFGECWNNITSLSSTGACGASAGGQTCANAPSGPCCSEYGYCGTGAAFCGAGCQLLYGMCNSTSSSAISSALPAAGGQTCENAPSGPCCSQWGFCGTDEGFCGAGCQSEFGQCNSTSVQSSPAAPSSTYPAGACGLTAGGQTCENAPSGPCCSQYGYCGTGDGFCGAGCQADFGLCNSTSSSSTRTTPSAPASTFPVGACGPAAGGQNCANAPSGPCCSQYGYCGTGDGFCGAG
ncbi:hypothetical protein BKA81DRAFT_275546, partial [Phyllosticta paracitricarpa]